MTGKRLTVCRDWERANQSILDDGLQTLDGEKAQEGGFSLTFTIHTDEIDQKLNQIAQTFDELLDLELSLTVEQP